MEVPELEETFFVNDSTSGPKLFAIGKIDYRQIECT
jgi:hypothetical protein